MAGVWILYPHTTFSPSPSDWWAATGVIQDNRTCREKRIHLSTFFF